MNGGQLPTNQLHGINWGALDYASRAPQLMSCNYYRYVCACMCVFVCMCMHVCVYVCVCVSNVIVSPGISNSTVMLQLCVTVIILLP